MIDTLIVPDVHCREFWKKPVNETLTKFPNADIVFLGDYLDPYPFDFKTEPDFPDPFEEGLAQFEEIIDLAKKNNNVHLLIGNHDASYIGPRYICECRHNYRFDKDVRNLFHENIMLFNICFQKTISNNTFVLSHAGITNSWLKNNKMYFQDAKISDIPSIINQNFQNIFNENTPNETTHMFWKLLAQISYFRGGNFDDAGSVIWADVREHLSEDCTNDNVIQLFGHTYLTVDHINIKNKRFCLDSQQCFYINENGSIFKYNDNKELLIS